MLDVLFSNETSEAEKRKILQEDYDIQMTRTMDEEVSVMCNLSKGVIEKSMAKGMAKGMEQGMQQGMTNGILTAIQNLIKNMGVTIEQAMSVLEVPEPERQKYMDLLKEQPRP